jgi:hypothetical protein
MGMLAVAGAGGAAWLAASHGWFLPVLWIGLLLAILALPPSERHLVPAMWLALTVAAAGLSWCVALDHEQAFRHTLVLLAAVLLFGLARIGRPGPRLLSLGALAVAGTSVVAVAQAAGALNAARGSLAALPPGLRERAVERIAAGRPFGTAALPGHFAILLVAMAPLLLERAHRARGRASVPWWLGLIAVAVGVVLTRSLAAVAVAIVLGLIAMRHGRWARGAWLALGMLAFVGLAVVALRGDLSSLEPIRLRWINWRTAVWVFIHHPWAGVGLGGIGQAGLSGPTGALNASPYAHCTPLQLLAEFGIAGAGLVVVGAVALVRLIRLGLHGELALALAVAAVPLHNLVDFSFYAPEVVLPWAVLAGALAGRCQPPPRRATSAALLVPILAFGAIASAAAWRGETLARTALLGAPSRRIGRLLDAARWQPWTVTPLLTAAEETWSGPTNAADAAEVEDLLLRRNWVRPDSPAWAEELARLRVAEGRPAEALPFALEAERRAPPRAGIATLVERCSRER